MHPLSARDSHPFARHLAAILTGLVFMGWLPHAAAQSDNFNDGDDAGWNRYDPISQSGLGSVGTWSFPDGNTYRIQSSPSPAPSVVGPSRAGSLREEVTYTRFYVSVDVVDWDPNLGQVFGLMARLTDIGLGTSDGYAMTYDVAGGDLDITPFTDEAPGDGLPLLGDDAVNMVTGRTYRLVFYGDGVNLGAKVFQLTPRMTLVTEVSAQDATFAEGVCGLLVFDNSGGGGSADATFDNYFASDVEPPTLSYELSAFGDFSVLWPTNYTDFMLQVAPVVDSSDWTMVSEGIFRFGEFFVFPEDRTAQPRRFYRLIRP